MNTAIGIALMVGALYTLFIGIGACFGYADGDIRYGLKAGAVMATILTVFLGLVGAAVAVMTA